MTSHYSHRPCSDNPLCRYSRRQSVPACVHYSGRPSPHVATITIATARMLAHAAGFVGEQPMNAKYGLRQEDAPLLPPKPITVPGSSAWFLMSW